MPAAPAAALDGVIGRAAAGNVGEGAAGMRLADAA